MSENKGQVIVYQSEDGSTQVDVSLYEETVWLNLNQLADLFQRDKSVISRHLRNIFKSGELARQSVVAKFATTAADGNKRIAAALFLWFLDKNRVLYRKDGMKRLPDNALVSITLMIAESRPADKDIMTKVIVNLINQRTLGE